MREDDLADFARVVTESPERKDRDPRQTYIEANLGFERQELISWAIELDGRMPGTIGFYRGFADDVGEVGYMLAADFQGQRIMSEALPVVLRCAYDDLALRMVVAYTEDRNTPSIRLLRRFGFVRTDEVDGRYRRWEHRRR